MKGLLILALILFSGPSLAAMRGDIHDCSGTNISTTYVEVLSANDNQRDHLGIFNNTATDMIICVNQTASASCTAADEILVADGVGITLGESYTKGSVYAKTVSGTESSANCLWVGKWGK